MKAKQIVLCALAALLVAGAGEAKRGPKKPKKAEIEGVITAVSLAPTTVTIQSDTTTVELNVTTATKIEVDDERTTFAALAAGMEVEATYDPVTLNALVIEADSEDEVDEEDEVVAIGTVVSADSATGQIVVRVPEPGGGTTDVTLVVNDNTELKIGPVSITPDELELLVGLTVRAEFDPVTFVADEIKADASDAITIEGTVLAVDAAAGTLSVRTAEGTVDLVVPSGAQVVVPGGGSLEAIEPGDTVRVVFLTNGDGVNIALRIQVVPPKPQHVTGVLVSVDETAGTITVSTRAGEVVLVVDASTDLRINGKIATLAELAQALADAEASGRVAKVSAQYFIVDGENVATLVRVNVRGRGKPGGGGNPGRGRGGSRGWGG